MHHGRLRRYEFWGMSRVTKAFDEYFKCHKNTVPVVAQCLWIARLSMVSTGAPKRLIQYSGNLLQ